MRIFIDRIGLVNGSMKAHGLLLIRDTIAQWRSANHGKNLELRIVGSGTEVVLRMTLVNSTDWIESDPNSVAQEDDFIASAATEHQMQLAQLRKVMLFDVVSGQFDRSFPLVLSTEKDDDARFFRGKFRNQANSIDAVPEVANFVAAELAEVEDDPLGMIAVKHLNEPTRLPIPSDTWLPSLVRCKSKVWDGAYRLNGSDVELCVVGSNIDVDSATELLSVSDSKFIIGIADLSEALIV